MCDNDQELTSLGYRLEDLCDHYARDADPLRRAFAGHLLLVAQALWSLRGEERLKSDPPEADALRAVLQPGAELEILQADGRRIIARLERLIGGDDGERRRDEINARGDDEGARPGAGQGGSAEAD
jgi:hypothetical protein